MLPMSPPINPLIIVCKINIVINAGRASATSSGPSNQIEERAVIADRNVKSAKINAIKKLMKMVSLTRCPTKTPSKIPTTAASNKSNIAKSLLFFAVVVNRRNSGDYS